MSLSSLQLDAFLVVCRAQNFTRAASELGVTQSALSQRIKNLEDELGSTLFTRDPSGAKPTDVGQRLLRYCHAREGLEAEFVESLKSKSTGDLRGPLRIAGFSTITRSLILPALKPLLLKHDHIQLELLTAELSQLPELLTNGRADFVFVNEPIRRQGVLNTLVGYERNVLIQSRQSRPNVFLDHDEHDATTLDYFKSQGKSLPKGFRRMFVGDIDAILESVHMGLGRAVAPKHLLTRGVEVVKGFSEVRVPVHLAYFEQPFYTQLHHGARAALETALRETLRA